MYIFIHIYVARQSATTNQDDNPIPITDWYNDSNRYEVATISRLLEITGLFCQRALLKRLYSAKETYNCKEPTNRSHPIEHPL